MVKKITCKYNNYYSCVFAEAYPGFSYFCFSIGKVRDNINAYLML